MKWLLVIIATSYNGGVDVKTVPYEDKLTCNVAALGIYNMNLSKALEGQGMRMETLCVLGPEANGDDK